MVFKASILSPDCPPDRPKYYILKQTITEQAPPEDLASTARGGLMDAGERRVHHILSESTTSHLIRSLYKKCLGKVDSDNMRKARHSPLIPTAATETRF